jgi:hypothetical protein
MTVVPDEPVMVADVVAGPEVVVAGTAITEVPSVPVTVLEVIDTGAVPVEGAIPVGAVSTAVTSVVLVSVPTEDAGVLMTESVAAAEAALSVVKWLDRPEFNEDAALDKMLENPEARDWVTAASVALAATLDKSEPKEEAKLERAEDAASVIGPVVVAVGLPLASESTDDWAEETALANSEAAEDTTLEATAVPDTVGEEAPAVAPVSDGLELGKIPMPRMLVEVDASVPFVAAALSEDAVFEPSNSDATEPSKPGVPVPALGLVVRVPLAMVSGEVDGTDVLLSASGTVDVSELRLEALSVPEVASVKAAEEVLVAEAVPSMMVDRPTVMAPREGDAEASISLEVFSDKPVPVGAGSEEGSTPIVPTSPDAERVETMAVEPAVGEANSAGRRPPVWPRKGLTVPVLRKSEIESDSTGVLATVGVASSLDTWPVDPTFWAAPNELAAVGWMVLLGAVPVGTAKTPNSRSELLGVGSTMVSGMGPVDPTELTVVRKALLKVGERGLLGMAPVGAALS